MRVSVYNRCGHLLASRSMTACGRDRHWMNRRLQLALGGERGIWEVLVDWLGLALGTNRPKCLAELLELHRLAAGALQAALNETA